MSKPAYTLFNAFGLFATDTLHWSHPEYSFRVRLDVEKLPDPALNDSSTDMERVQSQFNRRKSFTELLKSKTKAHKFHGYLEGDYTLATFGFYTNNLEGVRKLYQRYPELFSSIQRVDQYNESRKLAEFMQEEE